MELSRTFSSDQAARRGQASLGTHFLRDGAAKAAEVKDHNNHVAWQNRKASARLAMTSLVGAKQESLLLSLSCLQRAQ